MTKPKNSDTQQVYVTYEYVAERLGKSKNTIKRWIRQGKFKPTIGKNGRTPVWNKRIIDAYIESGRFLTR